MSSGGRASLFKTYSTDSTSSYSSRRSMREKKREREQKKRELHSHPFALLASAAYTHVEFLLIASLVQLRI